MMTLFHYNVPLHAVMGHGHDNKRSSAEGDAPDNEIPRFPILHPALALAAEHRPQQTTSSASVSSRLTTPLRFVARPFSGDRKLSTSGRSIVAGSDAILLPTSSRTIIDGSYGENEADLSGQTILDEFLHFLTLKGLFCRGFFFLVCLLIISRD
jgi:hypothetical protein